MPRFTLPNGGYTDAYTDMGLLEDLRKRNQDLIPADTSSDFMVAMAKWCQKETGAVIRTKNIREFILSLQDEGFVTLMGDTWREFGIDAIRLSLVITEYMGWKHKLLWSADSPLVKSTSPSGQQISCPISVGQLSDEGYIETWIREYGRELNNTN